MSFRRRAQPSKSWRTNTLPVKEYDKMSSQKDQEEKLIVSAWYNMGMARQKKAAEERLASTGSAQSFLARQRQATSSRRSYPGHVQPTAAR
ncbi:protein Hook homolog 3-like [Carassius carassius]|uniref:protein Hook homolog 3-like n=1 Tax=Carassius carassius TaxID=217509 RepID=UPI0028687882|nr:protein Hook homolog 3-like [Carassius carassius]